MAFGNDGKYGFLGNDGKYGFPKGTLTKEEMDLVSV